MFILGIDFINSFFIKDFYNYLFVLAIIFYIERGYKMNFDNFNNEFFKRAMKKIEEDGCHRNRCCCFGPTGPTGPTGPSGGPTGAT